MSYYDSDAADRAVQVFYRWCMRNGRIWQQPNRYETQTIKQQGREVVEIRNCNGLLAKYVEQRSGRLTRLR
jgi:hypothetical protein